MYSVKHIVYTESLCSVNHSYQGMVRTLLKFTFPDTSQRTPLWQTFQELVVSACSFLHNAHTMYLLNSHLSLILFIFLSVLLNILFIIYFEVLAYQFQYLGPLRVCFYCLFFSWFLPFSQNMKFFIDAKHYI